MLSRTVAVELSIFQDFDKKGLASSTILDVSSQFAETPGMLQIFRAHLEKQK